MSQNDKLLLDKGLPVLTKEEKDKLRAKWQAETWDDMIKSFNNYGKYIMLRPTGFGKTFTCACACNIGQRNIEKEQKLGIHLQPDEVLLNDGTVIKNERIKSIKDKKVIFVYVSEILKKTFIDYDMPDERGKSLISKDKNGNSRIIFETYSMVQRHWDDEDYLRDKLDIENVGLVIFDEVQRMGAKGVSEALDKAIPVLEKLRIFYVGATATVERSTGYDVCDKYFTYGNGDTLTYCWGEHIYTLSDTFNSGLIIPPEYQYIEENDKKLKEARKTRDSLLINLKAEYENGDHAIFNDNYELENAVIKNSSKIIHDTMLTLYQCPSNYVNNEETLKKYKNIEAVPSGLPRYMRFLVFTPDRASMEIPKKYRDEDKDKEYEKVFGGMVETTRDDFKLAFGRYGYKIRTLIVSSLTYEEKTNVNLIDNYDISEEDLESGEAIIPQDLTIDLIFSINMLNVGYHVNHITGLIFKRWTQSNQVFYQQLGRCLSSTSDIIPVVFDFVNTISSKGISSPMFTYSKDEDIDITQNADGTTNVRDSKIIKSNDTSKSDPRKCNTLEAKYITVGTASATYNEILERLHVYELRVKSRELYDYAYDKYCSFITVNNNKLISDITLIPSLRSTLNIAVYQLYNQKINGKEVSLNFKAYLEYLKAKEKFVFIEYNGLKNYINGVGNEYIGTEVNSILASARTNSSKGTIIKLLINKNDADDFKSNKKAQQILAEKMFSKDDIIVYSI